MATYRKRIGLWGNRASYRKERGNGASIRAARQELSHRQVQHGVASVRSDLDHRHQDEPPLGKPRVWERELSRIEDCLPEQQKIDVERSRPVPDEPPPALPGLDRLAHLEELDRPSRESHLRRSIHEPGLHRRVYRLGQIETGSLSNLHSEVLEPSESELELFFRAAFGRRLVRAQAEKTRYVDHVSDYNQRCRSKPGEALC